MCVCVFLCRWFFHICNEFIPTAKDNSFGKIEKKMKKVVELLWKKLEERILLALRSFFFEHNKAVFLLLI